jgi:hypothetical protein
MMAAPMPSLRWIPWAVAVVFLGAFFALGAGGWPGEFTGAGGMFCEHFRDGWVKQPANTWSNLGFVAAGLWMASRLDRSVRVAGVGRNLFTRSPALPVTYAALVVFLGPGSMMMHGSGRDWGATADVVSMLIWIAFPVAYAGVRCFGGGERAFWAAYLVLAVGLGGLRAVGALPISGSATYTVLIPAFVAFEVGAARRPGVTRQPRWLVLTALSFFTALAIWRLSHTGAPLCDPHSLLQGHAAWHLLCAVSTVGIFLFYATEDEGPPPQEARGG